MTDCNTCGVELSRHNVRGYCKKHVSAAIAAERPKVEPRRCHCGLPLLNRNKTGLCRKHANDQHNANPESQARRVAALKRRFAIDPELRAQQRERARKLHLLPQSREARLRRYTPEFQRQGVEAMRNLPEVRRRANAKMSATKLAWCPLHLRDEYRHLTQHKAFSAAEARAMIEDQHELEMARWRRSIGAPVEAPEQAEPTIIDPLTAALDLAARLFKVTSEQILSAARSRKFTLPRYAIAVVLKRQGFTTTAIANRLGKNDHTSALHWIKRGEYLEASERKFAAKVVAISGCWVPVEAAA